jgi:hypothetical protein
MGRSRPNQDTQPAEIVRLWLEFGLDKSVWREPLSVWEESGFGRQVGGGIANDACPGVLGFEVEKLHRLGIYG